MKTDISSTGITTISTHDDYVRITPLTIDATPLNYKAMFTDRTGNNSLNSTFINTQKMLNRTKLFHNKIFNSYHISLAKNKIVETMPTNTQQSISPIHPTLTTPQNKNTAFYKQHYNPQKKHLLLQISQWFINHLDQQRHHAETKKKTRNV